MAKLKIGDKVKVKKPADWPDVSEYTLDGAEGIVDIWVDWPEAMDPYAEYINVIINKAGDKAKIYEGAKLIFHEENLAKI